MKIGFACGVFDLFHYGHVLMLQECAENCDFLIVAINTAERFDEEINPNKNMPIFTHFEREAILNSIKYVDKVIKYSSEDELLYILKTNNINIRFLGDDYKGKKITGAELNIPIHYIDRSHGYSTSGLISLVKKR